MIKILFLHGFFASGQCAPAMALKEAFEEKAKVLTPDLPLHPKEAISFIRNEIDSEKPDLLVGNSCGSFYAQMVAPIVGLPALLGNPHFKMTEFLKTRIGEHQYKSPRKDGKQDFIIDEQLKNNGTLVNVCVALLKKTDKTSDGWSRLSSLALCSSVIACELTPRQCHPDIPLPYRATTIPPKNLKN